MSVRHERISNYMLNLLTTLSYERLSNWPERIERFEESMKDRENVRQLLLALRELEELRVLMKEVKNNISKWV